MKASSGALKAWGEGFWWYKLRWSQLEWLDYRHFMNGTMALNLACAGFGQLSEKAGQRNAILESTPRWDWMQRGIFLLHLQANSNIAGSDGFNTTDSEQFGAELWSAIVLRDIPLPPPHLPKINTWCISKVDKKLWSWMIVSHCVEKIVLNDKLKQG